MENLDSFTAALAKTVDLFKVEIEGVGIEHLPRGIWMEIFLIWLEERGWQLIK